MTKLFSLLAAALMATSVSMSAAQACDGHDKAKEEANKTAPAPAEKPATASFHVEGMHCAGCGDKVKAALGKTSGVVKVDVKAADKRIVVDYDAAKITPAKIAKIISDLGYKAAAEV